MTPPLWFLVSILLVALAVAGLAWARMRRRAYAALCRSLERAGLYDYVDPADRDAVRAEVMAASSPWLLEIERLVQLDLSSLSRGGVTTLLQAMAPLLLRNGVRIGTVTEREQPNGQYLITLDGRDFVLLEHRQRREPKEVLKAVVRAINHMLVHSVGRDRVYVVHPDSDPRVIFLNAALFAAGHSNAILRAEVPRSI